MIEYFILMPRNVYKIIIGVSANKIVVMYFFKLIPVNTDRKQITSEGTTGEETPIAKIWTQFFSTILYILGYFLMILSWYAIPTVNFAK
jgi:uncharacterized membrane protein